MDDSDKLELILEWAEKHPDFDTTFIDSLQEFYERTGFLTESQSAALDNIIERFHIQ